MDIRFCSAARLLQCLWLDDRDIPTGRGYCHDTTMELHSSLSPDTVRARLNFLSRKFSLRAIDEGPAVDQLDRVNRKLERLVWMSAINLALTLAVLVLVFERN
ncbi:hypothetical protein [Bradyrhizobium japonicum]|uniref:hypothetical protein n=1 Tax=Bradyrhizobium japonicum TaxID=375 RepID=UPI003B6741D9